MREGESADWRKRKSADPAVIEIAEKRMSIAGERRKAC
jgi:hypothetical protein